MKNAPRSKSSPVGILHVFSLRVFAAVCFLFSLLFIQWNLRLKMMLEWMDSCVTVPEISFSSPSFTMSAKLWWIRHKNLIQDCFYLVIFS